MQAIVALVPVVKGGKPSVRMGVTLVGQRRWPTGETAAGEEPGFFSLPAFSGMGAKKGDGPCQPVWTN
jgi:hypothetical protein